jgi:hypothetical protein
VAMSTAADLSMVDSPTSFNVYGFGGSSVGLRTQSGSNPLVVSPAISPR